LEGLDVGHLILVGGELLLYAMLVCDGDPRKASMREFKIA
jgi:hypothetical protein